MKVLNIITQRIIDVKKLNYIIFYYAFRKRNSFNHGTFYSIFCSALHKMLRKDKTVSAIMLCDKKVIASEFNLYQGTCFSNY